MNGNDIERIFTYHPPKDTTQQERYVRIRAQAKVLAYLFLELCPSSREQDTAIASLEMAVMWANAAIAREE